MVLFYKLTVGAALTVALTSGPAAAQNQQEHGGHHSHEPHPEMQASDAGAGQGAHVHGLAELLVVLDGAQLDIELHSPAMNLLGFEHQATSPEEQVIVENTKELLANASGLFQLSPAHCQFSHHRVDFGSVVEQRSTPEGSGHRGADEHGEHDDHGHSDIRAHYRYHCDQPGQLKSLTTRIPIEFPGVESLQVQWVIDNRQGAATLNEHRHHLNFR
ncbi:MAG: DUF2796 domain-containing protein [Pseudomonadota bacterium]|nr:DUF2796 domain-containing protein [Pseudomonadota bacterium]